mmetsp:Transcript_59352/g.109748  ORF Transcript_59352/g.109748 Transcript_59352/m.109748 type:complete len:535 (+) Transcript_59352:86-1690(+)
MAAALDVVGDGMAGNAEAAVQHQCRQVSQEVVCRAISLLHQKYDKVQMPTPALGGGKGGDQLAAYPVDPDVYRFFVAISGCAPGALRAEQIPNFTVPEPMLLVKVLQWLQTAIATGDVKADGVAKKGPLGFQTSRSIASTASNVWAGFKVDHTKLMPHQRDAVQDMLQRDELRAQGHFLVMDTGYGKTLTALSYMRRFLDRTSIDIRFILWVTPTELVKATAQQLQAKWCAPVHILLDGNPKEAHINVVKHDLLRTVSAKLAAVAPRTVIVFDEVDTMYAATLRTSAAHRIAALCPMLVCQTATPLRNTKHEQLAEWLQRLERFPVHKGNWLVAANGMVSKQIDLAIEVAHIEVEVPMSTAVRLAHMESNRDWLKVAALTQQATDEALVSAAVHRSSEGVLLVASDTAHVAELIARLKAAGIAAGDYEQRGDLSVQVVVVTKRHCRGYNDAARLGVLVTGVYPGNAADRHQLLGRLKRIGQRRSKIEHVTVYMRNTILHLLHMRHQDVDTLNISLAALGQHYSAEVLRLVEAAG